ncbi:16S rRNA (guanine966-N2)-methyltransferase [Thermosulfidibacter takaii ABI70S6]|uniref:16S rRNA (Guanine966-N2)-methyltransferase n=1 Tax=Thermosulfidibacter takaii (strain DSM 17441 / JCM 13301 / NBRC 103674 / ABI70S6) TaxID=1298851 RepID=A0A0S3QS25_THET7|nr:16S rRNA (guanine(966)-N(2))-methyltransferase RsmD [Thermosulfidibacter takaii]BAT71138.1 16S rRNA (guanine966-N2)-methyltransferase [Thermosulfidibacter takaii ABI70S6]
MIRITGGEAKGRSIKSPPGRKTRPILASIRKVLFDTLGERVLDANFLDVFGGVGTVGIEALSRGAKRAVFVEKDYRMARLIRENLELLGYFHKGVVIRGDAFKVPEFLKNMGPYDIIFLGPPYGLKGIGKLPALYLPLLSKGGILVVQHHHKTELALESGFISRVKRIGENQLTFYIPEGS